MYATITSNVQAGHVYDSRDRPEIDWLFRLREQIRKRTAKIKTGLARIEKDGAAIRKHCDASQAEIQTAIRLYKKQLDEAEKGALGAAFQHHQAKERLRHLSPFGTKDVDGELKDILGSLPL